VRDVPSSGERPRAAPPSVPASPGPATFRPLRHAPAYKALSAEIERQILDGVLQPGAALPPEQSLAEQFDVNRSTVREAIRLLEQEGLLVRAAGRRLRVTLPGLHDLTPRTTRALMLEQVTFRELWEVAVVLEPAAARLAAQQASAADLDELGANVEQTAACIAQGEPYTELDVAFHAVVARASRNRVLMLAREPVNLLYRPTLDRLQSVLSQAGRRNLEAHRRILDALRRRSTRDAETWMHKHLIDFQRGYRVAALDLDEAVRWPAS
jgi:GntR family transcriptional repressor for pyruvate dehydrogenase complex